MKYDYCIDTKCTIWERSHYKIEANSQEEADEIAKRVYNGEESEDYFDEAETIYDTMEVMTVEENDGQSTNELYRGENSDSEPILKNGE